MSGVLYVVATPIGNLGDITRRAVGALERVDLIACEDTRQTLKLMNHLGLRKPLVSYHEFNEEKRAAELIAKLEAGANVALVSDAGTPAISDPGYRLVRGCRERGIPVTAIPGSNAAVLALSASGLPAGEFMFLGFLPGRKAARRARLRELRDVGCTLVFYEAPHRVDDALEDMREILGDREASIGRELTKMHEEYLFGRLSALRSQVKPLGEFVIVIAGASGEVAPEETPLTREEALKKLGMSRNQLYDLFFKK